jgi:hypothetical protein
MQSQHGISPEMLLNERSLQIALQHDLKSGHLEIFQNEDSPAALLNCF